MNGNKYGGKRVWQFQTEGCNDPRNESRNAVALATQPKVNRLEQKWCEQENDRIVASTSFFDTNAKYNYTVTLREITVSIYNALGATNLKERPGGWHVDDLGESRRENQLYLHVQPGNRRP